MNTLGNRFRFTSFGESHGQLIGVVVDGCPPGIKITKTDLDKALKERRPGSSNLVTQRREDDSCEIVSGLLEDKTTGAPITIVVYNKDVSSGDYEEIQNKPRPGHADFPAYVKYKGFNDIRGGGRFSGRLTIAHVVAGAIAKQILKETDIKGGLVIHLGCGDGKLTAALCANESYLVHGLDPKAENIQKAREYIKSLNLYGRVSVTQWDSDSLPYSR